MDFLKKFWPASFKPADVKSFVITIVVYAVVGTVCGWILGWIAGILGGFLGWPLNLLASLVGLYCTAGIVFVILYYIGVFKNK